MDKRIKRQVRARMHRCHAATAPALRSLCEAELGSWMPDVAAPAYACTDLISDAGGVAFSAQLPGIMAANLYLSFANQVSVEVGRFKARDFATLTARVAALPWDLWLAPETPVVVRVRAARSRLYHSAAIAERVAAVLLVAGMRLAPAEEDLPAQQVRVRVESDVVVVSLNSSGALLHKRGLQAQVGRAPLRSTLAAAMVAWLGLGPGETLVDPMCGSGVFSVETLLRQRRIPAGWFRDFSFIRWPAAAAGRWAWLRRQAEAAMRPQLPVSIFAADVHPERVQGLRELVAAQPLLAGLEVRCADFLRYSPGDFALTPGAVVLNPPYGRRLGGAQAESDFAAFCRHLGRAYGGWRLALLVPERGWLRHLPPGLTLRPLAHGGLDLHLALGRLSP